MGRQFCLRGHDTFVVGRDPKSMCWECKRAKARAVYASMPPVACGHSDCRDRADGSCGAGVRALASMLYRRTIPGLMSYNRKALKRIANNRGRRLQRFAELTKELS